ncbi:hypothetical protein [Haloferula sargassicola]|uniref:PEP-CTERM protein-sorting domain-containing protein n=1 Tax=Haloferula sargassicola TaxID=490096 RepID=A0ABP9UQ05_9BACT
MNMIPSRILIPLLGFSAAAHAAVLVNESFTGYTGTDLFGNAATGLGLTGNWSGSGFFKNQATSLSMTGVANQGGSLALNLVTTSGKQASVELSAPLPTTTLYGSYLFNTTLAASNARTVGGIGVGSPGDNDNSASFVWSGNGYNSSNGIEGPNLRAEGSGTPLPTVSLVDGQTYVMLFEFSATAQTTSAWVLNEAQLGNFYGSLDAATLNAAATDTEAATGVAWRGTATGGAVGSMSSLLLFGYTPNASGDIVYQWDEIRISDTSLLESVSVPEPSVLSLASGLGLLAIRRRRRHGLH